MKKLLQFWLIKFTASSRILYHFSRAFYALLAMLIRSLTIWYPNVRFVSIGSSVKLGCHEPWVSDIDVNLQIRTADAFTFRLIAQIVDLMPIYSFSLVRIDNVRDFLENEATFFTGFFQYLPIDSALSPKGLAARADLRVLLRQTVRQSVIDLYQRNNRAFQLPKTTLKLYLENLYPEITLRHSLVYRKYSVDALSEACLMQNLVSFNLTSRDIARKISTRSEDDFPVVILSSTTPLFHASPGMHGLRIEGIIPFKGGDEFKLFATKFEDLSVLPSMIDFIEDRRNYCRSIYNYPLVCDLGILEHQCLFPKIPFLKLSNFGVTRFRVTPMDFEHLINEVALSIVEFSSDVLQFLRSRPTYSRRIEGYYLDFLPALELLLDFQILCAGPKDVERHYRSNYGDVAFEQLRSKAQKILKDGPQDEILNFFYEKATILLRRLVRQDFGIRNDA